MGDCFDRIRRNIRSQREEENGGGGGRAAIVGVDTNVERRTRGCR
jgi:hypothetical protein